MRDWSFLNRHRIRQGPLASADAQGFKGAFSFPLPGEPRRVYCIISDGLGWEHVSVSFGHNHAIPSWLVMEKVKNLFWNDDQWVIQFHPPAKEYANNHPGCLHLWRPLGKEFPTPDSILVGLKGVALF
jgi:hypothetical protein